VFPRVASRSIPSDTEIVVSWTGTAYAAFKKARSIGARCILDRGSSHPEYCRKILNEEYAKFDKTKKLPIDSNPTKSTIYNDADYVCIPSLFVKRTFLEYGFPEDKLIHVPYGVDLSEFYSQPKPEGVFRVIFVGGMRLHKGVHYLLEAFSGLNFPDAELWLVGPRSAETDYYFKKYVGHYKHFEPVPQDKLVELYNQASVFAICSVQEGLAMVQLQAMACGLPVICTKNTGGEDFIREGIDGFVIPIRDVEKIRERILTLYKNIELRKKMSAAVVERSKFFTWKEYGNKIVQAFEKMGAE
jgi:glycosyltransferase involved in cell wall biosynthesis